MQFAFGMNQSPVYWDRGRLAHNEREARKRIRLKDKKDCAPAAPCGRDARAPRKRLPHVLSILSCRMSFDAACEIQLDRALQTLDIEHAGDAFDGIDHLVQMLHIKYFHGYFDVAPFVRGHRSARIANAGFHI